MGCCGGGFPIEGWPRKIGHEDAVLKAQIVSQGQAGVTRSFVVQNVLELVLQLSRSSP